MSCCCDPNSLIKAEACLICGEELIYSTEKIMRECSICGKTYPSDAVCKNGHFVCDVCHSKKSLEKMITHCGQINSTNPVFVLDQLMNDSAVHMHGPEHHVLAGAAVLTAFHNATTAKDRQEAGFAELTAFVALVRMLREMVSRGRQIPGGTCGFWGGCGAALSCGTAYSIITDTTPMSTDTWSKANLLVSGILHKMGMVGGPRCCKRTSLLAVIETAKFLNQEFNLDMQITEDYVCTRSSRNQECIRERCPFWPRPDKKYILEAKVKCLAGEVLTKEQIIRLLDIPIGSDEDLFLRQTAFEAAKELTGSKGYIWTAVGMDFVPCEMNCSFCSFGAKWNVIQENRHVTEEEIIESFRRFVQGGAAYVILRTTEFYSIDKLLEYIPKIRKEVPGDYKIILNTGEIDPETAEKIANGGVYGIYHALRLREGTDTPFDPAVRIRTMKSVSGSPLKLISLTEPIGPEHSNEEIADRFLNTVKCHAVIGGAMARFPVPGTPFEGTRRLTDEEMAHIVAVLRLSGGNVIQDICVHPASAETMTSGANVLVVECGAIPRDAVYSESDWANTDMKKARDLLTDAGYQISHIED